MRTTVVIGNLKCEECRSTVLDTLAEFRGVTNIVTDIISGHLTFDYSSHNVMEGLRLQLAKVGHPITGDSNVIGLGDTDCIIDYEEKA
jgi:hypothetical protein